MVPERRNVLALLTCSALMLTASCAWDRAEPQPGDAPSVVHVVREGETLWDIARAYGVSVDAIQRANGLDQGAVRRLSTGASVRIPGATRTVDVRGARGVSRERSPTDAVHRFRPGETLWDVARLYDVSVDALLTRNGLDVDDLGTLKVGQPIIVPGVTQEQVDQAPTPKKRRGLIHEVQPGETVWDVARRYNVSVSELMAANSLSAEDVESVTVGQRLWVPRVDADAASQARGEPSPRQRRALAKAAGLGLGSTDAARALARGVVDSHWTTAASSLGQFPGTLKWPVSRGWFVRGYDSGPAGQHWAMDIAGRPGWSIRAAAPGIVGYAGNDLPGFGNTVIIVHAAGFATLYAHNSMNLVVAGEEVQRGSLIAEIGAGLHFELLRDGSACDPGPLLRPGVQHRSGRVARLPYTKWRNPETQPEEVRCRPTGKRSRLGKEDFTTVAEIPEREKWASDRTDPPSATGSCFAVDASGHIVTSLHVIERATAIAVTHRNGRLQDATVESVSEAGDLAVLSTGTASPAFLCVAQNAPTLGERVFTIGFPLTSVLGNEPKLTEGSISALRADARRNFMQVSVPIQPGNSGGPLVNERGEVVGVVTASLNPLTILAQTGMLPQGINFATNVDVLRTIIGNSAGVLPPAGNRSEAIARALDAVCQVSVWE